MSTLGAGAHVQVDVHGLDGPAHAREALAHDCARAVVLVLPDDPRALEVGRAEPGAAAQRQLSHPRRANGD